jgi:NitT/TauT family transport system ATP-binding protein
MTPTQIQIPEKGIRDNAQAKIQLDEVSLRYAGASASARSNLALNKVSFDIANGEFVAIIGPSGCGKSTLLRLVSGLLPATSGKVSVNGNLVASVPTGIGFLFQSDALLPWKTALENVALGATLAGRTPEEGLVRARQLLQEVGLGKACDKYPAELSGGMRKRVALSRTMAYEPDVFLLDEPFSALDAQTRIHVGNSFLRILEELGQTVIFVTHDIDEAIALADRVVVMTAAPGRIAAEFKIDLPRPRDYYKSRMSPGFSEMQDQIWQVLRREMEGVLNHEK